MSSEVVLKTVGLKKIYGVGALAVQALRGVDVEVGRGEFISIMGPSGCGKTTLLQLLGGLSTPSEGHIFIDGDDLTDASDVERMGLRRAPLGEFAPRRPATLAYRQLWKEIRRRTAS